MIIFGWGKKSKKIADVGLMRCKNCNNMTVFELRELSNKVSIYFIPVAKWKKQNYLVCPVCDAGFEIEENDKNDILNECIKLPDSKISLEIQDYIVDSFNKFDDKKDKLNNLMSSISEDLIKQGYKKDDISYVMVRFIDDITKKLEKE